MHALIKDNFGFTIKGYYTFLQNLKAIFIKLCNNALESTKYYQDSGMTDHEYL